MSGLYKRSTLSLLIIGLISLSCGPDVLTPIPGLVDVTATGTYRVHRKDGTLVFERKVDDLCVTRGDVVGVNSDNVYAIFFISLACFDEYSQKNNFLELYELSVGKYSRPREPFEGGFYFPNASILDAYLNTDVLGADSISSEVSYDNSVFASSCSDEARRLNMPVRYSFKRRDVQYCGAECVFKFELLSDSSNCYDVSAEIEFYVSGIRYE